MLIVDPWDMMNNFYFHVYAQKWHMSNAYVDPWDMLNNYCVQFHSKTNDKGELDARQ